MYQVLAPDILLIKFPFLVSKAQPGRSTSYIEALFCGDIKVERKALKKNIHIIRQNSQHPLPRKLSCEIERN